MGFIIEQECPQCGGPIELDETDHILRCPYCSVENYLFTPNYFRFILPHKATGNEIFYVPYLRFKGTVYYCQDLTIGHRFLDITHIGLKAKDIPYSLGLRPQAMKMKFVKPADEGSFLKFSLKATGIVAKAASLTSGRSSGRILHRAYIGETLSLIYLPLFLAGGKIFDAILNRPIADLPQDQEIFRSQIISKPKWKLSFIPTLCPQCGWNLNGEKNSVVLTCGNCDTAWEALEGKFRKVDLWAISGQDKESVYLPFWKISAIAKGVKINSFADFIRVTNQPLVIDKKWENQSMSFWIPAFKIRPKVFLQLSKQITVSQRHLRPEKEIPKKNLYPVTLPQTEAAQAMKITLADSTVTKKSVLPLLPDVMFHVLDSALIYLAFTDTGHEMVLQKKHISINKQALQFGRQL